MKLKYGSTHCFICFWGEGFKFHEKLNAYICSKPECLVKLIEIEKIDLSGYRVTENFRVGMDNLRRSTPEDFKLRNRLLNLLLAGRVNRTKLVEFHNFGIESMGKCIGGKPRKFSVSNITSDVLDVHHDLLMKPEILKRKIESRQIVTGNLLIGENEENIFGLIFEDRNEIN